MDKELKIVLSEMRRLMNYNRSQDNLINEQTFQEYTQYDNQGTKQDKGVKDGKTDIFYKQNFKPYKGFFDNDMMLGECFDVVLFTETDNALTSMDIPRNEIFKDSYGYYTKGNSLSFGGQTRIYLPKDEFFKRLAGVVKSFTAYQTCNDQKKRQGGRKYTLVYQLVSPEKAIALFTEDADGQKETSTDPSRGWRITNFAGNQSGYFTEDTTQEPEEGWGQKSDNPKNNMLPQYFNEYSLQNYGQEYARSEFDIWYDSGWGIGVIIGLQILAAIATAGIGNAISAAAGLTGWASTAVVVGAELSVEFTMGLVEANYLFDRGYNTGAYMVLIFSLFPVFNRLGFIERLSGRISEETVARLLKEVFQEAEAGRFVTDGDVKTWLKSLDDVTRRTVEDLIQQSSKALEKANSKEITDGINSALRQILNDIKAKGLTTGVKSTIKELTKEWPNVYGPTLKLIGIDLGVVLGSLPLFMTFVEDDEEIKRDPQRFMGDVKTKIEKFASILLDNEKTRVVELGKQLQEKATANPEDSNAQIELLNFFKDMNQFDMYESMKTEQAKEIYRIVLQRATDMMLKADAEGEAKTAEELVEIISDFTKVLIKHCKDMPVTNLKNKTEVCAFLDWVQQTKKDAQGNVTFKMVVNGTEYTKKLTICSKKIPTSNFQCLSETYLLNSCETKILYKTYGKEYEATKKK